MTQNVITLERHVRYLETSIMTRPSYPDLGNTVTRRWIEYLVQFDVQVMFRKEKNVQ